MINILIITQIKDVEGLYDKFKTLGKIKYIPNPSKTKLTKIIKNYEVIFTNPNNTSVFLGREILSRANKLKIICTASTGTVHIDSTYTRQNKIKIISLKKEIPVLNKISSTAELAFLLTLSHVRNFIPSVNSVIKGKWDYYEYIGNQLSSRKIGVLGYGRLGKKYVKYCSSFDSQIFVYDPYKKNKIKNINKYNNIKEFLQTIDILSIHIHAENNYNFINKNLFKYMKKDIIIINTSRGEVINEKDLFNFLKKNKKAKYATDVLSDESNYKKNIIFQNRNIDIISDQLIITPHIGGMTTEGKDIAYNHSFNLLKKYFKKNYD
jgi:phosphoglycerate dehydrogenase-like enzyme